MQSYRYKKLLLMVKKLLLYIGTLLPILCSAQKLKYKSDVEPILKGPKGTENIETLELYFQQGLGANGKPTTQTINYLREKMQIVCLFAGEALEIEAKKQKDYPTTDTAIAILKNAVVWYKRIGDVFLIKSDSLTVHIAKLEQLETQWKTDEQGIVKKILSEKQTLNTNLQRLIVYDETKAVEFGKKYTNLIYLKDYKQANKELTTLLKNLEYQKNLEEQKQRAALERKEQLMEIHKNEQQQKAFLLLQEKCVAENPCPNCPLTIAIKFRDAYHDGDIFEMKKYIIDYYGDEKIFYGNNFNLFKEFSEDELQKNKLTLRAKTADYKKIDPENVVYYTDNEEKDFFIDKNYKSHFLHATVFKAINDYDKIDLIKYNGQWKVYRVGGAYGGRSGKTIINGRFFFDSKFLQKEVKRKTKKN